VVNSRTRLPNTAAVRLTVTAVERDDDGAITALHGLNGQRPWRLTLAEALTAARTGRYVFEVTWDGERCRAELASDNGVPHLRAQSSVHGNLMDVLPDALAQER